MTGYGRAKKTLSNRDITVEVRSVNNRYLDCTVKLPRAYIFAEDAIKGRVQKAISRGKVQINDRGWQNERCQTRKVRASQGRMPDNVRRRRLQGQCNRNIPPAISR